MRIILIIINILCMIIHILFEIYIKENSGIYGFVLVENILVTFLFLVMTYLVFKSESYIELLYINLIFWLVFVVSVLYFKPSITTLQVFEEHMLQLPQWVILSGFGIATLFLNIAEIIKKELRNKKNG